MRTSVLIVLVALLALPATLSIADEFELDDKAMEKAPVKEMKAAEVKQLETTKDLEKAVETKVVKEEGSFLPKHELVEILGIASWAFILCTILTWWVLPKKLGRKRMQTHKVLGYTALAIATIHGVVVMFF